MIMQAHLNKETRAAVVHTIIAALIAHDTACIFLIIAAHGDG